VLADPQGSELSFLASPGTLAGRYVNPNLSLADLVDHNENGRTMIDRVLWRLFCRVIASWGCILTQGMFVLLAQDLKDFGREAGNVSFADIDRDVPGQGYVTFI
jgi:hypothetical protein